MKKQINNLKTGIPTIVLISIYTISFAQQNLGTSCSNAIDLPTLTFTNNKYSVKLTAKAKLHFDYEVVDFMGNVVFTKKMNVNKGEEKIVAINAPKLPSGILFHRFVFADGSFKSIQALKN